jgi:hypothetical protein
MCHVFSKGLSLALLWGTFGGAFVGYVFGAELALFCLIKVAQGDFFFWLPVESLSATLLCSFVARFANKAMVDFTGFFQFRNALDLVRYWA